MDKVIYLADSDSDKEAVAWAVKIPGASYGTVEVRKLWELNKTDSLGIRE